LIYFETSEKNSNQNLVRKSVMKIKEDFIYNAYNKGSLGRLDKLLRDTLISRKSTITTLRKTIIKDTLTFENNIHSRRNSDSFEDDIHNNEVIFNMMMRERERD